MEKHDAQERDVLKFGLLAGAAAALPVERLTGAFGQEAVAATPTVKLFDTPLVVPPVLKPTLSIAGTDYYDMTMRVAQQQILPGVKTPIWGTTGSSPADVQARRNRPIVIRQHNKLPGDAAVHLHGGNVRRARTACPARRSIPARTGSTCTRTGSRPARSGTTTTFTTTSPSTPPRG